MWSSMLLQSEKHGTSELRSRGEGRFWRSYNPKTLATLSTSLSPRPERLTRIILSLPRVGASFLTCAIACDVSSAGIIPFRPRHPLEGVEGLLCR